jgi:hypothetical protein
MLEDTEFKNEYLQVEKNLDAVYSEDILENVIVTSMYYGWLVAKYGTHWKNAINFDK